MWYEGCQTEVILTNKTHIKESRKHVALRCPLLWNTNTMSRVKCLMRGVKQESYSQTWHISRHKYDTHVLKHVTHESRHKCEHTNVTRQKIRAETCLLSRHIFIHIFVSTHVSNLLFIFEHTRLIFYSTRVRFIFEHTSLAIDMTRINESRL